MGKQMLRIGLKSALYVSCIGTALALMATPPVAQQPKNQAGVLSCAMNPTIGLIIGSHQTMRCEFRPERGAPERYSGVMNRIGLDLGITAGGQMAWAVLMSSQVPARWALTGTYVGGSGDISVGIGVGANLLIGGNNSSVALQPLSIEGQVGLNLALGVASLQLRPAQ
jgi:Protein of unknown function (DUF992)